jgi:hypothetical protein
LAKKKLSVLSDADEAALSKLSKKERAKAVVGQPDETDLRNITELLNLYERSRPGRLARMKADYDLQHALNDYSKPVIKGISSKDLRMGFWMPEDLLNLMQYFYPTIWTNDKHREWFLRHFPIFRG